MKKITDNEMHLHRLWAARLLREHKNICWAYKVDLRRPAFEIIDSNKIQGQWNPESRRIRIAAKVIKAHSWDVIVNLLKHEMAHQIVSEILKGPGRHDVLFRKACRMIGVPLQFCKASGRLPLTAPGLGRPEQSESSKTVDRVNKLLSLAQSDNEHEASIAMQRANELMAKYNIQRIEQNKESAYVYKIINLKRKRLARHQHEICSILIDFFFVEIVFSQLYDARTQNSYRTVEILGARENVLVAEHVYHFLSKTLNTLWKSFQMETGGRASARRSYFSGVLTGFRDKLSRAEGKKAAPFNYDNNPNDQAFTSALIRARDTGLYDFIKQRFPRLARLRSQTGAFDKKAYEAGKKKGRQLTVHKAVVESSGFQGKMLA
jgi:hypothetical protein